MKDNLQSLTRPQLQEICRNLRIRGFTSKQKTELVQLIIEKCTERSDAIYVRLVNNIVNMHLKKQSNKLVEKQLEKEARTKVFRIARDWLKWHLVNRTILTFKIPVESSDLNTNTYGATTFDAPGKIIGLKGFKVTCVYRFRGEQCTVDMHRVVTGTSDKMELVGGSRNGHLQMRVEITEPTFIHVKPLMYLAGLVLKNWMAKTKQEIDFSGTFGLQEYIDSFDSIDAK